jgi:DNA topoisomerase I
MILPQRISGRGLERYRLSCKNYYVHPLILSLYESKKLDKYIDELEKIEKDDEKASLSPEEKVVMKILESN